ncbi:MAG: hypothetical protein H8D56_08610 [Planctomycetes bacterium]|nr:hypothetical protein [Planctomycetota bacterium]MBL7147070.1 hypothetical protein [Phycisphaerae bacterium]
MHSITILQLQFIVDCYLVPKKDGAPDANGEFAIKLHTGQYQNSYTNGKDIRLLKEFEIDLDITLQYLHLNDIITLWL